MSQAKRDFRKLVGKEGLLLAVNSSNPAIFASERDVEHGTPECYLRQENGVTNHITGKPVEHGLYPLRVSSSRYPRAYGEIMIGNEYVGVILRREMPPKPRATGNQIRLE